MTSERAQKIVDASMVSSASPPPKRHRESIAAAIRAVADRFATDWGELQHPYDVLNEIADELEAL